MFTPRTSSGTTNASDDPLTRALIGLIPPDEDPVTKANRLALEAEAQRVSEEIDERLRLERLEKKNKKIVKILLLGQSDPPTPVSPLELPLTGCCSVAASRCRPIPHPG